MRKPNEDAQAAVIFLFILLIIAQIALFIWLGPVMDQFNGFHNNATQGSSAFLNLSQERQDSIYVTQIVCADYPIICFVFDLIAGVVIALKWRSSNV